MKISLIQNSTKIINKKVQKILNFNKIFVRLKQMIIFLQFEDFNYYQILELLNKARIESSISNQNQQIKSQSCLEFHLTFNLKTLFPFLR